jgi:hypothetical protein
VAALGRAPPPLLGCIGLGLEKQDRVQPGQSRGGCRRTGPRPGSRGRTEAEAGAPLGLPGSCDAAGTLDRLASLDTHDPVRVAPSAPAQDPKLGP